ncbi:cytochrome b N-terminal domain-containing protein [Quisquiliibacterium transsilvanicum]|uniref:Ferredoxin/coenzyme F420-reducing hydrogenase delta subunit n=1 Tax=Quisquiliibacterium transsilvanicum TaxID=1549638 RepID=A0A7W8M810_9BURK|nr:cytochrome b N-terminal domain-containing protein [Quisquiliibacterium transsilvanicum]MBB5271137.1 ferredoxin/coenzyme F420-reducing hydrogenase delta subunit [Quisquiliibacterium transsilvanicum]
MNSRVFAPTNPAEADLPGSGRLAGLVRRVERGFDAACGEADNPLRQLGALGFQLFWLVSLTGAYLYIFYDTSVSGAWTSVERLTVDQWWAGGVMRSLHRYASDAFALVIAAHVLRELAYGRFRHFRWYTWLTGVPTLWLAAASGVIGYWLVWDELAQFVGVAVTEWFGALPGFGPALVRNFIAESAMSDRFFSLLVFLHIGVPLVLLLAMWVHIQRLARARTVTSRAVGGWTFAALLALSLAAPVVSLPAADLSRVPANVPIDWFYLAPLPAIYAVSPEAVWAAAAALTVLLGAVPWLGRRTPPPPPAKVDPDHCNGCTRCFVDCPYSAITMAPHPSGRGEIAVVADDLCASCGICAGACPSSTPFRSRQRLVSGIDLPDREVGDLRDALGSALARSTAEGASPLVLFCCQRGAGLGPDEDAGRADGVLAFGLPCAGMLPPSFVEYALRHGAAGVMVATCPGEDCEFRLGVQWTAERLRGEREPYLRASVDRARLRTVAAAREERAGLRRALQAFRQELSAPGADAPGAEASQRNRREST